MGLLEFREFMKEAIIGGIRDFRTSLHVIQMIVSTNLIPKRDEPCLDVNLAGHGVRGTGGVGQKLTIHWVKCSKNEVTVTR
jgi:hypothetical protein